jgi:hypothetical protein
MPLRIGTSTISGFTIARNVEALGYPFIESVRAALPLCDEFIISEGFSSDRTWEAVQALANHFPDKIRIRRDRWSDSPDNGEVIAHISNRALADCRSSHCLYVQANEVVHEDALGAIAALPHAFPRRLLFSLPVHNILGRDTLWLHQGRNRLFRRTTGVCITGDGYDAGITGGPFALRRWGLRATERWVSRHERMGARGVYDRSMLPAAIFRYRALCPANYLRKIEVRRAMARAGPFRMRWDEEWNAAHRAAAHSQGDPATFWALLAPFFARRPGTPDDVPEDRAPTASPLARVADSPAVMRGVGQHWEFDFEGSLSALASAAPGPLGSAVPGESPGGAGARF